MIKVTAINEIPTPEGKEPLVQVVFETVPTTNYELKFGICKTAYKLYKKSRTTVVVGEEFPECAIETQIQEEPYWAGQEPGKDGKYRKNFVVLT